MAKKPETKERAVLDKLFVVGLDSAGKPRGARFAECKDNIVNAALDMMLSCVYPASAAFSQECGFRSIRPAIPIPSRPGFRCDLAQGTDFKSPGDAVLPAR
jgi:hypothetical protein